MYNIYLCVCEAGNVPTASHRRLARVACGQVAGMVSYDGVRTKKSLITPTITVHPLCTIQGYILVYGYLEVIEGMGQYLFESAFTLLDLPYIYVHTQSHLPVQRRKRGSPGTPKPLSRGLGGLRGLFRLEDITGAASVDQAHDRPRVRSGGL